MMHDLDALLNGAIDIHYHSYPDISYKHPQRRSNKKVIEQCREAGMGGLVLKTHAWPQTGLAEELNSQYDDFTVYPSVSMNQTAGGPYPWVVEMAHQMNCRTMWLPTWSARHDMDNPLGFDNIAKQYNPLMKQIPESGYFTMTDKNGELWDHIKETISLCKEYGIVLGTGHISTKESLAVAKFSHEIGFDKLCYTHPRANLDAFTMDDIRQMAEYGALIEIIVLFLHPIWPTTSIEEIIEMIRIAGGPEHAYLATDHFWDQTPSVPAMLDECLACMYSKGADYGFLKTLMGTPNRLLET